MKSLLISSDKKMFLIISSEENKAHLYFFRKNEAPHYFFRKMKCLIISSKKKHMPDYFFKKTVHFFSEEIMRHLIFSEGMMRCCIFLKR
jgi:hypothetical protein